MTTTIQPGILCQVVGLQSAQGKQLNGKRCAVLQFIEEENRWQVRMEKESQDEVHTKALKEINLKPLPKLPLPTGPNRGLAIDVDDMMVPKMCELLLYYKGGGPHNPLGDFQPSEIMFRGYAAMAFMRMGQSNFMHFTPVQIEQMGGVLALANVCKEAEYPGTQDVLFGLLEGDVMYLDVFIQTIHWTGRIQEEECFERDFSIPPTMLTPDQDAQPYVRTMKEGPVLLLWEMQKYPFGRALWAALKRSEFYHLLVRRLLRWTAREAKGTRDGIALGKQARTILRKLVDANHRQPFPKVSQATADRILEEEGTLLHEMPVNVEQVETVICDLLEPN